MAAAEGTTVILCDRMAEKTGKALNLEKIVIVPCLGRIEESVLCTLAADGVERVVLCDALCDGCDYENGHEAARLVRDTTQTLLDAWHNGMELRIAENCPARYAGKTQDMTPTNAPLSSLSARVPSLPPAKWPRPR